MRLKKVDSTAKDNVNANSCLYYLLAISHIAQLIYNACKLVNISPSDLFQIFSGLLDNILCKFDLIAEKIIKMK